MLTKNTEARALCGHACEGAPKKERKGVKLCKTGQEASNGEIPGTENVGGACKAGTKKQDRGRGAGGQATGVTRGLRGGGGDAHQGGGS